MFAIYKREMRSYFTTPVGYVFLGIFVLLSAAAFAVTTLWSLTNDVTYYFLILLFIMMVSLPVLTMKLFAEERKTKTEQLLLTAPVSIGGIVGAKFLAATSIFAVGEILGCFFFIPLFAYSEPQAGIIFGNVIASFLVGMSFIAIGIFISSLTENQLAAAIGTFAVLLALLCVNFANSFIGWYPIRALLSGLSVFGRYQNFTYGIFDFAAVLYYVSISLAFLFLSARVYEHRRWGD